jgi:hypothetical protein
MQAIMSSNLTIINAGFRVIDSVLVLGSSATPPKFLQDVRMNIAVHLTPEFTPRAQSKHCIPHVATPTLNSAAAMQRLPRPSTAFPFLPKL